MSIDSAVADAVADDTTLPSFSVPADIRAWGSSNEIAQRNPWRATSMIVQTAVWYASCITFAEFIGTAWAWILAWVLLVACMMRIDAVHHEAVHRSLFRRRLLNDLAASVTGAAEGFHAPIYRCFHLAHHALTRQTSPPSDPEDFYDETMTHPIQIGVIRIPARAVYVLGNLIGGLTFAAQLIVDAIKTMVGAPPEYVRAASLQRHVRRWGLLPFALWGAVIGAAVLSGHADELVRWWVIPLVVFLAGPYTFFALPEHYGAPRDGQMISSTGSVQTNAVYRWVTLDGNFHLAHHVFPNASWWWLERADQRLRGHTVLFHPGYLSFHRMVWSDMRRRRSEPDMPPSM